MTTASRFVMLSISFSASMVIEVSGMAWTSYESSEPSSSGFEA